MKGDPCYRLAKNLPELSFSVLWKVKLVSGDLEYTADIYYLSMKYTHLLDQYKIFCISIKNVKHYICKYNHMINYLIDVNYFILIDML